MNAVEVEGLLYSHTNKSREGRRWIKCVGGCHLSRPCFLVRVRPSPVSQPGSRWRAQTHRVLSRSVFLTKALSDSDGSPHNKTCTHHDLEEPHEQHSPMRA